MGAKEPLSEADALAIGDELRRLANSFHEVGNRMLRSTRIRSPLAVRVLAVHRAVSQLRSELENEVARVHGNDVALRVYHGGPGPK